jgi:hypothetical protein
LISNNPDFERKASHLLAYLLVPVVILGIVARILGIFSDFWLDEIWTYFRLTSLKTPLEVFTRFTSDNNHCLNSLFMFLIGNTGHWYLYRLPSLAAGLLTLPLVWLATRKAGRIEACIATILAASSYLLINYSSEARGYSLVIFFSIATYYLLQRCLGSPALRWRILLWVCIGLGVLSHLTYLFVLVAAVVWLPYAGFRKHERWTSIARNWVLSFGVPAVALLFFYLLVVSRFKIVGGPPYDLGAVLAESISYLGGEGQIVSPLTTLWGAITLALVINALFLLWRKGRSEWLFLFIVILAAPATAVLIHKPEVLFVRYFLINIFFAYIALSCLLAELSRRKTAGRIAAGLFLLVFLAGNAFQSARLLEYGRGTYREAIRFIGENSDGNLITIASDNPVRNGKLVDFYKPCLPTGKQVLFLERYGGATPPLWFIRHIIGEPPEFSKGIRDIYGHEYALKKICPYAGPSGWYWLLYRRMDAYPAPGIASDTMYFTNPPLPDLIQRRGFERVSGRTAGNQ